MSGLTIEKSMEFGSGAASIVISSHSCSDAMPTRQQVEDYMERCNRGEITAG
ncbi:5-keto-2-deoxygluconokinase [Paenibacillus sp. JCM 10914]|nr:5-keto-2-deoxygluconokinase [Paenibacillus sp. JCM 10914]